MYKTLVIEDDAQLQSRLQKEARELSEKRSLYEINEAVIERAYTDEPILDIPKMILEDKVVKYAVKEVIKKESVKSKINKFIKKNKKGRK